MFPELFSLGPLSLKSYGLFFGLGFLAALAVLRRELRRSKIDPSHGETMFWLALVFGLLGSRLLYFLTNPVSWSDFWRIWEGGLSFTGGLLVAYAACLVYMKIKALPYLVVSDAIALGMPLALALARLGCLMAGCCWGKWSASGWAIVFNNPKCSVPAELLGVPLHPTQLYEASGALVIFAVLNFFKDKWKNKIPGIFVIFYGLLRFSLEFLRGDASLEPSFLGMTFTQSAILFILWPLGIIWVVKAKRF
ncbi:MAG: prolipoprotein diacylglyceryl transferase [Elusimicrobia bacterium]|nr:prolipoprotein diacylglyceryl transferase [Elusimicrobiota bacterium]